MVNGTTTYFVKKILLYGFLPFLLFLLLLSLLATYTHTGRVWSLYAFAAMKAPTSVKYECIKDTRTQVTKKFKQPLQFDESAKDGLREYWHFSYYRHCLFEAGYDFYGNPIPPSSLTNTESGKIYTNYFAQISFSTPSSTSFITDNVTDPDLDDYLIASTLSVDGSEIFINVDRSYKVTDLATLESDFAGFMHQKDTRSPTLQNVDTPFDNVLAFSDDDLYGYVVLIPEHHIVTIFGDAADKELLDTIASTIEQL